MRDNLIICRSITQTQRAVRALRKAGVSCEALRIPVGLLKSGCGYAVRISSEQLQITLGTMQRQGITPAAVFENNGNGYNEVAYDLS